MMKKTILITFSLLLFTCCSTTRKASDSSFQEHLSSKENVQTRYDSVFIFQKDTITLYARNDTVFIDRYHYLTQNSLSLHTDTLILYDTIYQEHIKEKVIQKPNINKQVKVGFILLLLSILIVYIQWKRFNRLNNR